MREASPKPQAEPSNWTRSIRRLLARNLPLKHLLPDRQPVYVGSWVYVFGVVAIAGLIWVIASGVVLAFFGPQWWHEDGVGRFVNSLHLWSVQVFFIFMVLHLWGQYFMAGWRDGRAPTWMVGVVIFAFSIVAAFTGFISQQNFEASGSRSTPRTRRMPPGSGRSSTSSTSARCMGCTSCSCRCWS